MPKDIYLQPHAPDPVLADELVLSLVRRHVPSAQAVTAVDESGGEARTYAIDDELIFKTQRPHRLRPRTNLQKEVFFLNQIAAHAPELVVPRVLGHGRADASIEYTLMTRVPGVALRRANLDAAQRREVMRELGRVLWRVHTLPLAAFTDSGLFAGDRDAGDVRARFAEWFEELSARIRDEQRPWSLALSPEQLSQHALAVLPKSDERVPLHSNPWHEHTFVDARTGQYTGLIDFGDAYISHATFDLRRWRARPEREMLIAGYTAEQPPSDAFRATWWVAQVLGDLAAIATSDELAPAAHADLEQLLAEM